MTDEKTVPVMIIPLKDTNEDRLNVYFKLLEGVEQYGIDKTKCLFTWIEEENNT